MQAVGEHSQPRGSQHKYTPCGNRLALLDGFFTETVLKKSLPLLFRQSQCIAVLLHLKQTKNCVVYCRSTCVSRKYQGLVCAVQTIPITIYETLTRPFIDCPWDDQISLRQWQIITGPPICITQRQMGALFIVEHSENLTRRPRRIQHIRIFTLKVLTIRA